MTNLLKLGKKIFTVGVVATTIFWSLGVAALVPAVANAATETDCATLMAGDLVKTTVSPVIYAVNADKTKSYFPQGDVFKSWTADNKYAYKTISQACLSSLKSATAVLPRPGTYLVKEAASDAVYMVLPGNKLAELSATAATALYGTNYKAMPVKGGHTITMDDPSWTFYSQLQVGGFGVKLTETMPTEGALVKVGTTYYVVGANKTLSEVTATGLTANRFQTKFAHTLTATTGFTMSATKTEAEVATLTDRTQGAKGPVGTTTTNTIPAGALTLSLSAETPAGTSLPLGASNVDVLKLNAVNTGANDAILDEVIVKRSGVGSVTGLTAYLYDGDARIGTGKTFASDSNEALFSALNKTVKAGQTMKLSVRLQVTNAATTLTGNHAFAVTSAKLASGTVGGSFPLVGSTFNVNSSIGAGSVVVASNGTLSSPVVGDAGVAVAQFKLTAGTEDVDVSSFTLKNNGSSQPKDSANSRPIVFFPSQR